MSPEPFAEAGDIPHELPGFFHPEHNTRNKITNAENDTSAGTLHNRIHGCILLEKAAIEQGHNPLGGSPGNPAEKQCFEKHPEQIAEMENLNRIFPQ